MRDIGYSLDTALADIIDNSITAGASQIQILVDTTGDDPRIGILDDGSGMSRDELLDAMRLGSKNPLDDRGDGDLGRFGLGLKTASFSQCRHLAVVSRRDGTLCAAIWDLDYVAEADDWLVQLPDDPTEVRWAHRLGAHGTLVVWSGLDRLVDGSGDRTPLNNSIAAACKHLELVFHRFLKGEPGLSKVTILLNGKELVPWSPFPEHTATQYQPPEKFQLDGELIEFQSVTLPHHSKVTPREWEEFGGDEGYLRNQGFYVYREKRLIIHGTWFGLAKQSELTKLARVRVDMPNGLDSRWKVDVKKSSAQLPYPVRQRLRRVIEQIGGSSKRAYTTRGKRLTDRERFPFWYRSKHEGSIYYRVNAEHPAIEAFTAKLSDDLVEELRDLLSMVSSSLPMDSLFADLGNHPGNVKGEDVEMNSMMRIAESIIPPLRESGLPASEVLALLENMEPFATRWPEVGPLIHSIVQKM